MVTRGRTRAATLNLSKLPLLEATSALGHEQTSRHVRVMSVIPLKADIRQREWHVRYVPLGDIAQQGAAALQTAGAITSTASFTQGNSIVPLYLPLERVSVRVSEVYVPPPLAP